MGTRSRTAAALVLLLSLGSLAACGDDAEAPGQELGELIQARTTVDVKGKPRADVVLPTGVLQVRAGDPVRSVDAGDTRDLEAVTAPAGSVLVPLSWSYRSKPLSDLAVLFGEDQSVSVEIVSGGSRYTIAPPAADAGGRNNDAFYVTVEGDAKKLSLAVDYAGVSQTVDLTTGKVKPGRARGLYALRDYRTKESTCPSTKWIDLGEQWTQTFGCVTNRPLISPFVDGRWAPPGRTFLVIGLTSNLTAIAKYGKTIDDIATYAVRSSVDRVELEGQRPLKVLIEGEDGGVRSGFYVFEIDDPEAGGKGSALPRSLTFDRTYRLTLANVRGKVSAKERRDLVVRGRIPLSY